VLIPKTPQARGKKAAEYLVLALEVPEILESRVFTEMLEGTHTLKHLKREIRENLQVARAVQHQSAKLPLEWVRIAEETLADHQPTALFPEYFPTIRSSALSA
jgi:hypothetical protein